MGGDKFKDTVGGCGNVQAGPGGDPGADQNQRQQQQNGRQLQQEGAGQGQSLLG